jgi:hypothetical protein
MVGNASRVLFGHITVPEPFFIVEDSFDALFDADTLLQGLSDGFPSTQFDVRLKQERQPGECT